MKYIAKQNFLHRNLASSKKLYVSSFSQSVVIYTVAKYIMPLYHWTNQQYLVICFITINVLDVCRIDHQGIIKVSDFGLSKLKVCMNRCILDRIKMIEINCPSNGWQLRALMMEYSQKKTDVVN